MREVPLTHEQKTWLRANTFLPTIFLGVMLLVLGGMLALIVRGLPSHPVVIVFVAIAVLLMLATIVAVGMHVRNNRADLRRGTASVARGRLSQKHRTARAPYTFYATFEHAGRVIVMGDVYERLVEGETYEVTFSPRTRRGWDVR